MKNEEGEENSKGKKEGKDPTKRDNKKMGVQNPRSWS